MSFSVDTALRKARKHFENDDVVSARKIYQQILEKYPENQRAISGYNRASQSCESAHNPSLTQDEIDAVLGLFNKGLFEEAICKIYGLLEHHSTSYFLYNVLAVSQANSNHLEDAEAAFLMASKFASNKSEAYVNLANIQCKIGKIDKAITNYKQALESNPDELAALNNLGSLLVEKGQNQEAISILKRQIKIDPHQPKAFFSLSLAFKNIHQVEAAIGAAKRAIQLDRRFIEAYQNLGKLLIQTGRFEEAATILQTANKIAPENSKTTDSLAFTLAKLGKLDSAFDVVSTMYELDMCNVDFQQPLLNLISSASENLSNVHPLIQTQVDLNHLSQKITLDDLSNMHVTCQKLRDCIELVSSRHPNLRSPATQVFQGVVGNLDCTRHFEVFNSYNQIARQCYSCFKTQLNLPNIIELIKVMLAFRLSHFPQNNTRKCMIESRPGVSGSYKAFIYSNSFFISNEYKKLMFFGFLFQLV